MKINQKIKAAILEENFKPLAIKNIFLKNKLKKKQILVKILYSGICGSQIGEINSIKGKDKFLPHLLGHEATGKVVNVFNKKSKFKIGDKVVLHWQKSGSVNSSLPEYHDNKNRKINAGWVTTFNDYAVVSENRLTMLPKKISNYEGVLFGCGLTTAYGALFNNVNIKTLRSKKILLTGFGMIGQIIMELIVKSGLKEITVIENNKRKIKLLRKKYKNINIFKNLDFVNKQSYDLALETTGNNRLIEFAYNNLDNKGKLILIGVPHHTQKIRINTLGINYGKKIIGSYGGNINPKIDIPRIAKFIKKNKINLRNFLCGPFGFNQINKVIQGMEKGLIIKKPVIKLD